MPAVSSGTVSACLIVRDEEERLPAALASVAFCDEVVVVDSGSQDRTVAIALGAGAIVVEHPWAGFGAQRNVSIDHATSEWVLELDADERVSPALRAEIQAFLAGPPPAGAHLAALPLRDSFLGGTLGPSAKYPKYRYRLFRRGRYRHDERRRVHEGLWADEAVVPFAHDLEHLLAADWGEALGDVWRYARLESAQVPGHRSVANHLGAILVRPTIKLAARLVLDGGWRDGWRGWVKVALDAGSDALVNALVIARRSAPESGRALGRSVLRGTPRLVAVAHGASAARAANAWLGDAAAAGADVSLVTDSGRDADGGGVRIRRVPRFGPLNLYRAMDAEHQLRPVDGLLLVGARSHRLAPLVRRAELSTVVGLADDPAATVAGLRRDR